VEAYVLLMSGLLVFGVAIAGILFILAHVDEF